MSSCCRGNDRKRHSSYWDSYTDRPSICFTSCFTSCFFEKGPVTFSSLTLCNHGRTWCGAVVVALTLLCSRCRMNERVKCISITSLIFPFRGFRVDVSNSCLLSWVRTVTNQRGKVELERDEESQTPSSRTEGTVSDSCWTCQVPEHVSQTFSGVTAQRSDPWSILGSLTIQHTCMSVTMVMVRSHHHPAAGEEKTKNKLTALKRECWFSVKNMQRILRDF